MLWKKSQKVGQQFLCCQEDRGTIRPRHCCAASAKKLYYAELHSTAAAATRHRCGIQSLLKNSFRLDFEAFKTDVIRRLYH